MLVLKFIQSILEKLNGGLTPLLLLILMGLFLVVGPIMLNRRKRLELTLLNPTLIGPLLILTLSGLTRNRITLILRVWLKSWRKPLPLRSPVFIPVIRLIRLNVLAKLELTVRRRLIVLINLIPILKTLKPSLILLLVFFRTRVHFLFGPFRLMVSRLLVLLLLVVPVVLKTQLNRRRLELTLLRQRSFRRVMVLVILKLPRRNRLNGQSIMNMNFRFNRVVVRVNKNVLILVTLSGRNTRG